MFSAETIHEISKAADRKGVEPAALLAVAKVESNGTAFAMIDGRPEPLIRFEAHYFHRRLTGEKQRLARAAGLASPKAGAVANPATQAERWRLLAKAVEIDPKAAYESTSWGIGQVMGAHWTWLGYASVEALVEEARSGIAGQMRLMLAYIEKAGLAGVLQKHDWHAFARGYNGPNYRAGTYHLKLAQAYELFHSGSVSAPAKGEAGSPTLLRRGSSGEQVRDLQRLLSALGYPLAVDGRFGPATEAAVKRFQRDEGLAIDGIAGPATIAAIQQAMPFRHAGQRWLAWLSELLRRIFP
ncbi:putative peptidoglycan-binding domain-containing protein [Mesorhizobium sp. J18]|uniref:N-acetylmuramidase domain-containing protein n=1 Tax=Mesorhizobium sp. J18 TaxID=935263 RepID=UPI00119B2105|nr:N-acetylmuramidase domain-containing protein [Mesorhizobium sp. J18]TWH00147.1 putative peptidoglycan-binding domain-containing protein [Mesorhizobium sp. J18]